MCGMQHVWLEEEQYFLVVPVDEDMAHHKEDVGVAPYREKKMIF